MVSRYYTLSRPEIAAFSLKISHVAEQGNKEAINILIHQATLLANEIIYLIKRYPQNNISIN